MRYNYVIVYVLCNYNTKHSFYIYKEFSPNNKVGLNETVNNRLSCMIKAISLNAYRPI